MFDSNWQDGQLGYLVFVIVFIAGIAYFLIRTYRSRGNRSWPVVSVGIYAVIVLLSFLFGVITQVTSEGFGFFPLLVLTSPWSWLVILSLIAANIQDSGLFGSGLAGTFPSYLLLCVFLAGSVNCLSLYRFLKWRQKKSDECAKWELARRNR